MKKIIIAALAVCTLATSCQDFLTKQNPNAIESEFFFTDETALQLYTNGFIRSWMPNSSGFFGGDSTSDTQSFDGQQLFFTDRFTQMDQTSWSWTTLRSVNYYLEKMRNETTEANCSAEVLNHYEGVGRFFRALFYIDKMQTYGAVPWYDKVIDSADEEALYKERDARSVIAKHIFEDLDYAAKNCSTDAKYVDAKHTLVNKYVALAMKARFCLFEGTYRKYHTNDPSTGKAWTNEEKSEGTTYLNECVKACEELMNSGKFTIIDDPNKRQTQYRAMFNTEDNASSCAKEWIWAHDYDEGYNVQNTGYSINDYFVNAQHAQYAYNRDFVMTYLCLDGNPFTSKFQGKEYYNVPFNKEFDGRDYRMKQSIRHPGFTRGNGSRHYAPDFTFAKTGYQPIKYLMDEIRDELSQATYIDFPILRYAEVLLNYAEAKAELGQMSQAIWDKTVKPIRERAGVKSIYPTTADPYMKAYFLDSVSDPFILEIRRERGTELNMEYNLRVQDDMRWHMGQLFVRQKTGMYIAEIEKDLDLDEDGVVDNIVSAQLTEKKGMYLLSINYNGSTKSAAGHILSEGDHGYILVSTKYVSEYSWPEKKYLRPIPNVSVTMNEKLGQNAGW